MKEALGEMCRHASHRPGAQASLSVRIQGEMVWGDFPFPLPFLPWPLHVHLLDSSPSACTLSVRRACGMWSLASELGCRSVSASPSPRRPLMQFQTFHLAWLGSQGPSGLLLSHGEWDWGCEGLCNADAAAWNLALQNGDHSRHFSKCRVL